MAAIPLRALYLSMSIYKNSRLKKAIPAFKSKMGLLANQWVNVGEFIFSILKDLNWPFKNVQIRSICLVESHSSENQLSGSFFIGKQNLNLYSASRR